MNRMVMIIYNEAIDTEIMESLDKCGLDSYTKIPAVFGKGKSSGRHLGNDIWPGRNNILWVACKKEEADLLLSCIRPLKERLTKEGLKAFVFILEQAAI